MSYDPRNARDDDPETSLLGTAGIQASHIEILVAFLRANDRPAGWTTGEIRDSALGLSHPNIWRRISDAHRDGLAEPVVWGDQIVTRTDHETRRAQRAWRAARTGGNVNPVRPCLWIDPGMMTGLAVWVPQAHAITISGWFCDEYDFDQAADGIEWLCHAHGSNLDVGWEDFHVGPKTPAADAHYAIEMIGVARRAQRKNGCRNVGPAQPDQRKLATRRMLEAVGWWVPAKDDAQSAAQHMLAWMHRTGQVPEREAAVLAELRSRSGG